MMSHMLSLLVLLQMSVFTAVTTFAYVCHGKLLKAKDDLIRQQAKLIEMTELDNNHLRKTIKEQHGKLDKNKTTKN